MAFAMQGVGVLNHELFAYAVVFEALFRKFRRVVYITSVYHRIAAHHSFYYTP